MYIYKKATSEGARGRTMGYGLSALWLPVKKAQIV
jgi:hypothetical protein